MAAGPDTPLRLVPEQSRRLTWLCEVSERRIHSSSDFAQSPSAPSDCRTAPRPAGWRMPEAAGDTAHFAWMALPDCSRIHSLGFGAGRLDYTAMSSRTHIDTPLSLYLAYRCHCADTPWTRMKRCRHRHRPMPMAMGCAGWRMTESAVGGPTGRTQHAAFR